MLFRIYVGGKNLPIGDPNNDYSVALRIPNSRVRYIMDAIPKTSQFQSWDDWFNAFVAYVRTEVEANGGRLLMFMTDGVPYSQYDDSFEGMGAAILLSTGEAYIDVEFDGTGFDPCSTTEVLKVETFSNTGTEIPVRIELLGDGGNVKQDFTKVEADKRNLPVVSDNGTNWSQSVYPEGTPSNNSYELLDPDAAYIKKPSDGIGRIDFSNRMKVIVVNKTPIYTGDGQYRDNVEKGTIIGFADGSQSGVMRVISQQGIYLFVSENDIRLAQ